MNQNLKSNFMQRCVDTRDPLWHAMVVWPLLWGWGHMALSSIYPAFIQQCVVWCGDNGGHWAHYLTNSPDLYSDTTLNTSHVPGNCTRCTADHNICSDGRNQLQNKLTSREGTEKLCIFRNILHSSSHPMQRTERRIMLCLGLYFVSSCKLEMS